MSNKTDRYDVIFVRRNDDAIKRVGFVAEDVDKETATQAAAHYCHRTESKEGVVIVYHGSNEQVPGSEWWH